MKTQTVANEKHVTLTWTIGEECGSNHTINGGCVHKSANENKKTNDDGDRLVNNNISTCRELVTYGVSCGKVIKSILAIKLV